MFRSMNDIDKWIKRIDWIRLIVAVAGVLLLVMDYRRLGAVDLDYGLSNVVGTYVLLMGIKTYLIGKNIMLAWFYLFFSAMMLIAVNIIQIRFG